MATSPTEKSHSISTMSSGLKSDGRGSRDLEAATTEESSSMVHHFEFGFLERSNAMIRLERERMATILQARTLPKGGQR